MAVDHTLEELMATLGKLNTLKNISYDNKCLIMCLSCSVKLLCNPSVN